LGFGREKDFAAGVPTTITAVFNGTGDWQKLRVLVDRAKASSSAERYFLAEEKAAFGPCVTDPEKIVCIGLNYRRHAAETGQPVPKQPIQGESAASATTCFRSVRAKFINDANDQLTCTLRANPGGGAGAVATTEFEVKGSKKPPGCEPGG
jgi:2-keto-4-pentenoate hydratase/2-oxohepta-3-ene-1,7-dioic acid hydratase in catechol pathway